VPELPDVETFKRYVDSTSLHHRVKTVEVNAPRMLRVASRNLRKALEGSEFSKTQRLGKHMLIRVKGGPRLAHMHLLVHFANGYRLACIYGKDGLAAST